MLVKFKQEREQELLAQNPDHKPEKVTIKKGDKVYYEYQEYTAKSAELKDLQTKKQADLDKYKEAVQQLILYQSSMVDQSNSRGAKSLSPRKQQI
jgi:hypothetical protein